MEYSFLLLSIVTSFIFGRKSILLGFSIGLIIAVSLQVYLYEVTLKNIVMILIFGSIICLICSVLGKILLPGLRGGNHNSGPSFMGGFGGGGRGGASPGGIILSDEEREKLKK